MFFSKLSDDIQLFLYHKLANKDRSKSSISLSEFNQRDYHINHANEDVIDLKLERAIKAGNTEKLNQLLSIGADPNHTYFTAEYPKPMGIRNDIPLYTGEIPLQFAIQHSNAVAAKEMVEILIKHGADVNQVTGIRKGTSLHCAAGSLRAHIAKILIDHGADINALDHNSHKPVYEAEMNRIFYADDPKIKLRDELAQALAANTNWDAALKAEEIAEAKSWVMSSVFK